jgi:glucosylceramidase
MRSTVGYPSVENDGREITLKLTRTALPTAIGILFCAASAAAQATPVQLWITTSDDAGIVKGLEQQPDLAFGADSNTAEAVIDLDDTKQFQAMIGGGASLTDGAAWLINEKLSPVQRDEVMRRLFDPREGIGLSFLRNPMGSSDLTRKWYTYDDDASDKADPSLPHFSIDHDRADVLPLTKWARRLNPDLTLMMNPWSPPAWMKSSGSLVAGGVLPEYYAHDVNYFVKTIQAYEAEGVHIDYVTMNNEPTCCIDINYPSVRTVTSDDMIAMLKNYWFPAFQANHLTTKILLLDFNWGNADLLEPLLQDPAIRNSPFVGGVAWHGYGGDVSVQSTFHDRYGLDAFLTERSGFTIGSRQQKMDFRLMVGEFRNWGKSLVLWPVATDENFGPHVGGCDRCTGLVMIHTSDAYAGRVDYGIQYYTMGHFTKFVRKGAYRIDSTASADILNVAFKNPDGSIVLIAYNDTDKPQSFRVRWRSQSFDYTLPVNTSVTFRWQPPPQ